MQDVFEIAPNEAAQELLDRKRGRETLIGFTEYTMPKYTADPFHHLVAEKLEAVERGEIKRLMIFAPPRHGKSELSTRRFPAWFLGRNPDRNIISASYNADFAKGFGRQVRDIIESPEFNRLFPEVGVRTDTRAAEGWKTTKNGEYFAVGVNTSTTGRGAHLFLIDDPIKDRKEADSETVREDQWNWYRDVVYTRLEEDAAIVMTLTRWHYDDLAGRALEMMKQGKGLPWDIIVLPALPQPRRDPETQQLILNEDGTVPGDPLGRKPNEPLAPNRMSLAGLLDRQDILGDRSWSALYQQQPMSEVGGMFQPKWFGIANEIPQRRVRVRAWDLGASLNGDFTVGVLMSRDINGFFYIEDVIRFRGSSMDVEQKIKDTATSDGRNVRIIIPQDPGQAGKSQAERIVRQLAGWNVKAIRPTGSKETRATGLAAQAEGGNVKMLRRQWNQVFLDELATFPLGTFDDQVDAAADAFNALIGPKKVAIRDW